MNQRVLIEKNYLRIPIRKDAVEKNVWLYQELTAVLQFQAGLFVDYGSGAPDFYAELPVERWKGSVLTLVHEEDRPVPFLQSDELLPNTEPFQPWIHFAPKSGWMNDVCGACWYQGSYHLYFQHNPFGVQWNNMSWRQTQSLVIPEAWECPDLVRLRVQSTGEEKWLFWTPDGFYLVGEFDGMQFTATQPGRRFYGSEKVYAAQTVANLDGRVLQIPFLRGHTQPYYNHRGLMGAPREMQLQKDGGEYVLSEPLCRELQQQKIPLWRRTVQKEPMEFCWEEDGAMLLQLTFSEDTSFALWICGERIEWDAEKKKLAFTFMNRLDILEIRNMTILADRGVLEIAVNEDTACYYVPGNGELVKSIELSGEMEVELFLIR